MNREALPHSCAALERGRDRILLGIISVPLAFLLEETARKILPEAVLTCCAMRDYSLIRATNHGLLLNAAHAPPVVPTPALHAASHQ